MQPLIESSNLFQKPDQFIRYRTVPVRKCNRLKKEVYKMLAMKVIEPEKTECTSSIVFVTRKDGTLPFT